MLHEPARLLIIVILALEERASFADLLRLTGMSNGNLHNHLRRLDQAGYVEAESAYRGKREYTIWQLSEVGRSAFEIYQQRMKAVCQLVDGLTTS
ncbi:MAG: transcriptional regulator [Chloroflexi bacterium]|nr:transcriptional regulator [Chloroflexota bacterium]